MTAGAMSTTYPKKLNVVIRVGYGVCVDDEEGRTWAYIYRFSSDGFSGELLNRWNTHDDLVEAAKQALDGMDGGADDAMCHRGMTTRDQCVQCRRVDALRAAIAKAEGRP